MVIMITQTWEINSLILPSPQPVNGVANFQVPSIDLEKFS